ncbi:hypothetical protein GF342_00680 [Candidatus Woesearchaeota archaeon]|nr:hypothetical protein [Candidatus Woesearchaeota archaeon]
MKEKPQINHFFRYRDVVKEGPFIEATRQMIVGEEEMYRGNYDEARQCFRRAREIELPHEEYVLMVNSSLDAEGALEALVSDPDPRELVQRIVEAAVDETLPHGFIMMHGLRSNHEAHSTGIADCLSNWEQYSLSAKYHAHAACYSREPLRQFTNLVRSAVEEYHAGEYQKARELFGKLFGFSKSADPRAIFFYERGEQETRDHNWSTTTLSIHKVMHVLHGLLALYSTGPCTNERIVFHKWFGEVQSALKERFDARSFQSISEGFAAMQTLYAHHDELSQMFEKRTTHRVFRLNEYAFKGGTSDAISNEAWVLSYFKSLGDGRVPLSVMCDDEHSQHVADGVSIDLSAIGPTRTPSIAFRLSGTGIPPHLQHVFPPNEVVIGYGLIPGQLLFEYLQQPGVDHEQVCGPAIDQLARLHAVGPKHLLEVVEGNEPHNAQFYVESMDGRIERGHGWTRGEWEFARPGYEVLARCLERRSIDSWVKDAHPLNWIILPHQPECIMPVDFESVQIAGPGYDLAKLLEHVPVLSEETKECLLDRYYNEYNAAALAFNSQAPKAAKPLITDLAAFRRDYLAYVVDFCVKSIHDPHYRFEEFAEARRQWMRRGAEVVSAMLEMPDFSDDERSALQRLAKICDSYRGSHG